MGIFSREVPEERAAQPVVYSALRPITASAANVSLKDKDAVARLKKRIDSSTWQTEAWDMYELLGEIHFSANLISNITSRVRLYPGFITSADTVPSNIFDVEEEHASKELKEAAVGIVRLLNNGPGGVPGLLKDAALNLFIAGECYLVREPAPKGTFGEVPEVWQIRSVNELVIKSGRNRTQEVYLKSSRNDKDEDMVLLGTANAGAGDLYFNRIWRNHPRYSAEADSSLRPQLENCDQLLLYERAKRAVAKSRLNAGLLYMPDGLSNAVQNDGELIPADDEEALAPIATPDDDDSFEEEFIEALTTPIADESSASAVVPLLVRGPAELGEKIRHITFTRNFDPQISTDAERLLERILAGLDLPKDVVSGVGSAKYANAVVIEESMYKAHIEPLVLSIVDALTVLLMKPMLKRMGFSDEEVARVVFWYDPSAITTKPDKATAATTGYENKIISAEAWRRAHGFSESDAPSGIEILQRLAQDKGLLSEVIVEAALKTIAPDLFEQVRAASIEETDPETQAAVSEALGGAENTQPAQADETTSEEQATSGEAPTPPSGLLEP